jgi:hypothetical protein
MIYRNITDFLIQFKEKSFSNNHIISLAMRKRSETDLKYEVDSRPFFKKLGELFADKKRKEDLL